MKATIIMAVGFLLMGCADVKRNEEIAGGRILEAAKGDETGGGTLSFCEAVALLGEGYDAEKIIVRLGGDEFESATIRALDRFVDLDGDGKFTAEEIGSAVNRIRDLLFLPKTYETSFGIGTELVKNMEVNVVRKAVQDLKACSLG